MAANQSDGSIIIDTELDSEGFEQGTGRISRMLNALKTGFNSFGEAIRRTMESGIDAIRAFGQSGDAYDRVEGRATQTADANSRFTASMNEVSESVSGAARAADEYDRALAKTQKQIDAQKAKLSEYFKQIEEIKQSTDEALKKTSTDEQAAAVLEIEKIELQKLNDKYAAQLGTLRELEAEYARLAAAQSAYSNSDTGGKPGAEPPAPNEQKISLWQRLGGAIRAVGTAALRTIGNLAKIPFTAVSNGIRSVGKSLKSYTGHARKADFASNVLVKTLTSMKRMLITRVKRMFISSIFNSVRESIQTLAKFSSSFDAAMSSIKNSAKQLSGYLSVTLGGLIQNLQPAITAFINALSIRRWQSAIRLG